MSPLLYNHLPSHSSGNIFVSSSLCYHLLHHLLPTYVPLLPTYLPTHPPSTSTLPFFHVITIIDLLWLALHHHQIPKTPTPMTQSCDSQSLCAMTSHNTFYLPLAPCLHMPPPLFVSLPQISNQLQACYQFFGFVHLHEVALGMPIVVSSFLFFVLLFL